MLNSIGVPHPDSRQYHNANSECTSVTIAKRKKEKKRKNVYNLQTGKEHILLREGRVMKSQFYLLFCC